MLFKMLLDASSDEERPIVRGLLKHILVGFGLGLLCGAVMLGVVIMSFENMDLGMPVIWIGAMMLQTAPIGGLIGAGVYLSRITERDDDDDDENGGGSKAPDTEQVTATLATPTRLKTGRRPATAA